jgi:hypothetical protein
LLEAGPWRGLFTVDWRVRWTTDFVAYAPDGGANAAPATWEHRQIVDGWIDLVVAEAVTDDTPAVSGEARGGFVTRSTAIRDDGAGVRMGRDLLLSGGALRAPAGRMLVAGDSIEWLGGELTDLHGFGSTWANYSGPGGGPGVVADGAPVHQSVGPIRFRVQSADCRTISGVVEGLGFDPFWLTPEAIRSAGTPTLGTATDLTVLSEHTTFTITRPPTPLPVPPIFTTTRVHGTASLGGQPAPPGTAIVALIGGVDCTETRSSRSTLVSATGTYVIDVRAAAYWPGCGTIGATITFTVGGVPASQTATFRVGGYTELNLTAQPLVQSLAPAGKPAVGRPHKPAAMPTSPRMPPAPPAPDPAATTVTQMEVRHHDLHLVSIARLPASVNSQPTAAHRSLIPASPGISPLRTARRHRPVRDR